MALFKTAQQKDLAIGNKFQKRFKRMIVGRDKLTGKLVVLFRSKNEAMLSIKTNQKEPQILERKNDKS